MANGRLFEDQDTFLGRIGLNLPESVRTGPQTADEARQLYDPGGGLGIAKDLLSAAGGQTPPSTLGRAPGELSTFQKVLSPIADIIALSQGGGLPSARRDLQAQRLRLAEQQIANEQFSKALDDTIKVAGMLRTETDPAAREAIAAQIAPALEARGKGLGFFIREHANNETLMDVLADLPEFPEGSNARQTIEIMRLQTAAGNPEAAMATLATAQKDGVFEADLTNRAVQDVGDRIDDAVSFLRTRGGPEARQKIEKIFADGKVTPQEFKQLNDLLPEDMKFSRGTVRRVTEEPEAFLQAIPQFETPALRKKLEEERVSAEFDKPVNLIRIEPDGSATRRSYLPGDSRIRADLNNGFLRDPSSITGTLEETGFGKTQVAEIRDQAAGARSFLGESSRLIGRIRQNPKALGVAGAVQRGVVQLSAQATAFAEILGSKFVDENGRTIEGSELQERVLKEFDHDLGVIAERFFPGARDSAIVKSSIVSLAYAAATASGAGKGRALSDKDIEFQLRRIGVSASPEIFESVLREVQEDIVQKLEDKIITARSTGGKLPPGLDESLVESMRREFGLGRFRVERSEVGAPVGQNPFAGASRADLERLTEEDVARMSPQERALFMERAREILAEEGSQ